MTLDDVRKLADNLLKLAYQVGYETAMREIQMTGQRMLDNRKLSPPIRDRITAFFESNPTEWYGSKEIADGTNTSIHTLYSYFPRLVFQEILEKRVSPITHLVEYRKKQPHAAQNQHVTQPTS